MFPLRSDAVHPKLNTTTRGAGAHRVEAFLLSSDAFPPLSLPTRWSSTLSNPGHQKSTCITQSILGLYVVQIWSRGSHTWVEISTKQTPRTPLSGKPDDLQYRQSKGGTQRGHDPKLTTPLRFQREGCTSSRGRVAWFRVQGCTGGGRSGIGRVQDVRRDIPKPLHQVYVMVSVCVLERERAKENWTGRASERVCER